MDADGNSEAQIAYGGEFHLADETGKLIELDEVTEINPPEDAAEAVTVTHMKSPKKRIERKPGMIDPGTGTIVLNYIPGSPTDKVVAGAMHKVRAFRQVIPDEDGEGKLQIDGFLYIASRSRPMQVGQLMQTTLNVQFTGANDEKAYVQPAGGA
ncbi:phage tail tube protein [Sphingomonas sp.]|uniref:phage tail tube protein n=1 Tax=Sphingomonas sp. TaxID=28214 RepID=UPI0035B04A89